MHAQHVGRMPTDTQPASHGNLSTLEMEVRAREMRDRFIAAQIGKAVRHIAAALRHATVGLIQRRRRARRVAALLDLNDRLLEDVGLTRSDVLDYIETGRAMGVERREVEDLTYALLTSAARQARPANRNVSADQAA